MKPGEAAKVLRNHGEPLRLDGYVNAAQAMDLGAEALELLDWMVEYGGEFRIAQAYRSGQKKTVSIFWNDRFLSESTNLIDAIRAAKKASGR